MTEIEKIIASEIPAGGAISFARFMDLALYCPDYGFYEKEADTVGRSGHFFTSVSVGSLFGELLACQFASWLVSRAGQPRWPEPVLVEAGAHDGKLALDLLNGLANHRRPLYDRVRYIIVEPSERRRAWQANRLAPHASRVSWVREIADLPRFHGVLFSNELLDAFPVHRCGWDLASRRWFEWGVGFDGERFLWMRLHAMSDGLDKYLPNTGAPELQCLPDNYIVEVSPSALDWWRQAAERIEQGRLLAIDYGLSEEDALSPHRLSGTLRAYHDHKSSDRILDFAGRQDLTAHVNFPEIIRVGEAAGLKTESFGMQGRYLTRLVAELPPEDSFAPPWDPARNRQFATLTHPAHLGHVFKILVQSRIA